MRKRRYLKLLLSALSLGMLLAYFWLPVVSRPPVAFAHAFVIGSDPVDGSTVSTAPVVVRLFFNAAISPASIAHVFAPDGEIVDASRSTIPRTNARELDTPLTTPEQLPDGSYTVRWVALSNDDGHTIQGTIGFTLGSSSTGLPGQGSLGASTSNIPPELDVEGILSIAWEWLVLLALTFWVGILVMEGLMFALGELASTWLASARKQTLPLQWLCLIALLAGELINLILRGALLTSMQGNDSIDLLALRQVVLETNYGRLWLIRLALIGLALAFLWWTTRQHSLTSNAGSMRHRRRPGSRFARLRQQVAREQGTLKENPEAEPTAAPVRVAPRRYTFILLILAGLLLLARAPSGDAAQLAQQHLSAIVLNWLYLTAQCLWFGGAAYLGYILLPLLQVADPDTHAQTLALLLRRYTPLVLGAFSVLLVSGLFLSEASLSDLQQLISDPYGRALLVEMLLITFLLILSIYALFFLAPRLSRQALAPVVDGETPARPAGQSTLEKSERRLKRTMRMVAWLGGGVLLCAALMAFFAPPIVLPALASPSSTTSLSPLSARNMQTKQVGDLSVTLLVLPARIHYANTVIITMVDNKGNPVTDAQLRLSIGMKFMDMGIVQVTIKGGNPTYVATFGKEAIPFSAMFGAWEILVQIQRPNQPLVQAVFQVIVSR